MLSFAKFHASAKIKKIASDVLCLQLSNIYLLMRRVVARGIVNSILIIGYIHDIVVEQRTPAEQTSDDGRY